MVDLPALVIAQRLGHGAAVMAAVDGHVVLIAVLADVLEKRLQGRRSSPPRSRRSSASLSAVISPSPQ